MKRTFKFGFISFILSFISISSALGVYYDGNTFLIGNSAVSPRRSITDPDPDYDAGGSKSPEAILAELDAFDISVGEDWTPVDSSSLRYYSNSFSYYERDELNHRTYFNFYFLENLKSPKYYSVIYRIVTSPQQARHWGFLGIGSYGDNWSFYNLDVKAILQSGTIINWSPKNQPLEGTVTEGFSFGTDGTSNISYSISYPISELSITSKTNVASGIYETIYSDVSVTDYTKNSAIYTGAFAFECSSSKPHVAVSASVTYYGEYYKTDREQCKTNLSIILEA